jgi:hypothetical protein
MRINIDYIFTILGIKDTLNGYRVYRINKIINKFYLIHDNISIFKPYLKIIFYLLGLRININDNNFYLTLVRVISGNILIGDKLFLRKVLTEGVFKRSNVKSWILLRDILYIKGEYIIGGLCRDLSLNLNCNGMVNKNLLNALIENLIFNRSSDTDKEFIFKNTKAENKELLVDFLSILNCQNKNNKHILNSDFSRFVSGKNIAIVGPASTNIDNGIEIDSYDLVVRLNYTYSKKGVDEVLTGTRTDISYFNGEQSAYLLEKFHGILPKELKFSCIKGVGNFRLIKEKNKDRQVKLTDNFSLFTFYSSFTLAPLAILDLLHYNVKSIKLFNIDLFLTRDRHPNYYPNDFDRNNEDKLKKTLRESFIDHDPLIHYMLMGKLYQCDRLSADKVFDDVMALGREKYLEDLESIYQS